MAFTVDTYEEALTKQANAAEQPQQRRTADRLRTQLDAWKLATDARAVQRNDPVRAEEMYRRAIDADPTDADFLGNYVQLLFAQKRDDEAVEYVNKASAN
jgi:Tfp pilus assembly protein PilF